LITSQCHASVALVRSVSAPFCCPYPLLPPLFSSFSPKRERKKKEIRDVVVVVGGTRKNNKHPKTDRNKKTAKSFVFFYSPSRESQTGRGFD
jgi:hypothetical protein